MLSRLVFSDYKNLKLIFLSDLTYINFLVGENNSGKSRILEYIDEEFAGSSMRLTEEVSKQIFESQDIDSIKISDSLKIMLIDEPELHLHPKLQKTIPYTLQKLQQKFSLQLFVGTHSPFIISSCSKITRDEKQSIIKAKGGFLPSQKVYFVKDGQITNRNEESGTNERGVILGSNGYWGYKALSIAQRMLGAGLSDLVPPQDSRVTTDSPVIFFCEGEGKESDAKFYNNIFHQHIPDILFVSSRGSSQLLQSFELLGEIKRGLSANVRLAMVKDRDHFYANNEEIQKHQKDVQGLRILKRRALECYIYSSETISSLLKSHNLELSSKDRRMMNSLSRTIQREAEEGVVGSHYKSRLKELTKQILKNSGYLTLQGKQKLTLLSKKLSHHIKPGTRTYSELYSTLFDEDGSFM